MPIIKDNYENYTRYFSSNTAKGFMKKYGCKKAEIELDTDIIEDFLKVEANGFKKYFCKDRISKSELKKYCFEFYSNFLGKDFNYEVPQGYNGKLKRKINGVKNKDIFKVPVRFVRNKSKDHGALEVSNRYPPEDYYVQNVELLREKTYASVPIYIHEIAHALSCRYQNSIENLVNGETLSMFVEKVGLDYLAKNCSDPKAREQFEKARKIQHVRRFSATVEGIQESEILIKRKMRTEKAISERREMKPAMQQEYYINGHFSIDPNKNKLDLTDEDEFKPNSKKLSKKERLFRSYVDSIYEHAIGGIYSYALWDKYRNGTDELQEKIRLSVRKCFESNDYTVEKLIDEFDIKITKDILDKYTKESVEYMKDLDALEKKKVGLDRSYR